jgi:hypothetical protein
VEQLKTPLPVVQAGGPRSFIAVLFFSIPFTLHYELFPGNKLDKETFRSIIGEVRKNYGTGRIVVVADMGVITGDNIYYLTGGKNRNGYVFSFSIRGGTEAFKDYVLDQAGYVGSHGKPATEDDEFKIKSRRIAREINVTMRSGKTAKKIVYEKQVVFWAKKYADKARAERGELVKKAMALIADPQKYSRATSYGAAESSQLSETISQKGNSDKSTLRPVNPAP